MTNQMFRPAATLAALMLVIATWVPTLSMPQAQAATATATVLPIIA